MTLTTDLKEWRDGILADVNRMTSTVATSIRLGRIVDVVIVLGSRGTPLTLGTHVFLRVGLNGPVTILNWSMAATVGGVATAGGATIDLLAGPTMGSVATIVGATAPALAGASERNDVLAPSTWLAVLPDPTWLMATVVAIDGVLEVVGLTLRVSVDPRG